jgi:hypothetical protein
MAYRDNYFVKFGSESQRIRFERLFEKEMSFQIYPENRTMTALGISESVKYMINQLGWSNLNLHSLPSYRKLTLEFLSSFTYDPDYGYSIHKGLARFRLFGVPYRYCHREIAELMNVPNGHDAATKLQEDEFMDYELRNFWGSI